MESTSETNYEAKNNTKIPRKENVRNHMETQKKTAKWIREQTKLQDMVKTIKMLKWNWARHIMRTNDDR